ncbi:MAG: RNA polymerase sporulation sigma factor SigK [Oscillospiraceae bacterium]|jgi:RNA polymerase sporulation-specific sigma factor|nr:RNA polymerase sporulation sigma factor SigK [Oscillospiraceae bacterium]
MLSFIFEIVSHIFFLALHIVSPSVFPKPLSSKEEKKYLDKMSEGDKDARAKLIEHNLRLVAHIIKKFHSSHENNEDLISVGTIGLIKAVNTFKIEKGIRLSSYASRCIENEILMYMRGNKKTVLDVSMTEPIETSKSGSPLTLIDTLASEGSVFEEISGKIDVERLQKCISCNLSKREEIIIKLRYGLEGKTALTQQEIADRLGISRSYVSRIEKKVIEGLRVSMAKENG